MSNEHPNDLAAEMRSFAMNMRRDDSDARSDDLRFYYEAFDGFADRVDTLATQSPSSDIEAERLRIGDKVEVIGEHAADWRGQDLWVAGIRVHDSGEGLDITLAEQWPVPNRHWRGYRGQTDGFREHELIRVAALKETPNVG
jgi:hypothetical protein